MRLLQLSVLVLFILLNIGKSHSHSGGLNASGCHGGSQPYHCHRLPSEIRKSSSGGTRLRCDLGSRSEDCYGGSKRNEGASPDSASTRNINRHNGGLDTRTRKEAKPTSTASEYLLDPGFSQSTLRLQILLIRHCGFLPIDLANGVMTDATKDALHVFQRTHGINSRSESALPRTLQLLRSSPSGNCKINVSQRMIEKTNKDRNRENKVVLPKTRTRNPSPEIRLIQEKLNFLGFNTGSIDGYMGPNTHTAIKNFQSRAGLESTGKISDALNKSIDIEIKLKNESALLSENHVKSEQKKKEYAQRMQAERTQFYLGVLDLYQGPRDGMMNEKLEQAILRFQVANKISADGVVSTTLLNSIKSRL